MIEEISSQSQGQETPDECEISSEAVALLEAKTPEGAVARAAVLMAWEQQVLEKGTWNSHLERELALAELSRTITVGLKLDEELLLAAFEQGLL